MKARRGLLALLCVAAALLGAAAAGLAGERVEGRFASQAVNAGNEFSAAGDFDTTGGG